MPQKRPGKAWAEMMRGNARFVAGEPNHPRQDIGRRESLAHVQHPDVVLFGCSDSRLAAEIIFDKGLGDLFVVRNAGQVVSDSAIGSLEYAVGILNVPLVVVLGHDGCGAVAAAIDSQKPDAAPLPPAIDGLVQQIVPSVKEAAAAASVKPGEADPFEAGRLHIRRTITELLERSEMISDAVANNTLGIVGANYKLAEGRVVADAMVGISELPEG
ncbi:carbonic anhydrase [Paramicrobacterium chengjingii]|uniref:Carbonic anhydrase n=1 Tax=Paramicrobacterium chengjingii TaxID=2769067 RepID=A0ABX6YMN2_9MICO|nr:carbonic anhydrase [Microbacterium chengjingii]QPZ39557.1 carbonic anhydrase [Microbacterium chengjingii]